MIRTVHLDTVGQSVQLVKSNLSIHFMIILLDS